MENLKTQGRKVLQVKVKDWTRVPEGGGSGLEPGFYVMRVTEVVDHPSEEFLEVTYDVAEGPDAGRYSDEWSAMHPWAHSMRKYYRETCSGMFSRFLGDLEKSNPGRFSKQAFSATGNERSMVGLVIGCAVQKRLYTKKDGTDGEGLEVAFTLPADDVRTGNHKELPAPRDTRQGAQNGAQAAQAQSQAPQGYEPEIIPF